MQKVISKINSLEFETVCVYGVGVPSLFFDRIKGEKTGVDNFDKSKYPRSWNGPTTANNILSKPNKKRYDVVVINDSKHYKDLTNYFKQALKNIKEEGKIIFTHSMPKGGYKVTSFDDGVGMSIIEIDETKQPKEIDVFGFEEVYLLRNKLMSN